jgi:hypothetical protein
MECPSDKAKLGRLGNALKHWSKRGESQGKSHGLLVAIESQECTNRLTAASLL